MPSAVFAALLPLLPPGTGAGWADPKAAYDLWPGEDVPRATPARRAEFAAGRHAARMALRAIGLPDAAIAQGPDRAPVWPPGVIGSISHSPTACLAVVRRTGPARGIGLDMEPAAPLDPALWDTVLLRPEQAALPAANRGLGALRLFCAKEAAFKAFYPTTRALVGFEVLAVQTTADRFTATFQTALPPLARGDTITGRIVQAQGHILALALL